MRAVLVLCAAAWLSTPAFAQPADKPPDYYSSINYVEIAVRVLDDQGRFLRGLTAADFEVTENGRPQQVASFSMIDASSANPGTADEGRVYGVLIDDLLLAPEHMPRVRNIVTSFLEERLGPADTAGLGLVSGRVLQNYTTDRHLLIAAMRKFGNGILGPIDAREWQRISTRRLRSAIRQVTTGLGEVHGRRKALIVISPSHVCSIRTDMVRRVLDDGEIITCGELLDSAVRAGVSLYAIDPRGPTVPSYAMAESDGQERGAFTGPRGRWIVRLSGERTLAEETGGFAVTSTNNFDMYLDRMVAENTTYYLVGYYSSDSRMDGKFRDHAVTVRRPGVRVLHRPGYVAARSAAPAARR